MENEIFNLIIIILLIIWSVLGIFLSIHVSNLPHVSLLKRWYYFFMSGPLVWFIGLATATVF